MLHFACFALAIFCCHLRQIAHHQTKMQVALLGAVAFAAGEDSEKKRKHLFKGGRYGANSESDMLRFPGCMHLNFTLKLLVPQKWFAISSQLPQFSAISPLSAIFRNYRKWKAMIAKGGQK